MIFGRRRKRRLLWGFFARPVLPLAFELLLIGPLILGVDAPDMAPLYLFLSPWLLLVLGLVNLPLLNLAFHQFHMDRRKRRNHALEHATIHFLWVAGLTRVAGRAAEDGFRISGGASPRHIQGAFEEVRRLVLAGKPLPHVSRHCGSNRITALALAVLLLLLVVVFVALAFRPPLWVRAIGLAGVVLVFAMLRHAVGNWVQARLFMATDFTDAWIRDVRKAKVEDVEVPPAYFVVTTVQEREYRKQARSV